VTHKHGGDSSTSIGVEIVEGTGVGRVETPLVGYCFIRFHVAADEGGGQEVLAVVCGKE